MPKTCLPCNAFFDGEICEICFNPNADYVEVIEEYKGLEIKKYTYDAGYRVDFGARRSKVLITVDEARELIDFYYSPEKWNEDESKGKIMTD